MTRAALAVAAAIRQPKKMFPLKKIKATTSPLVPEARGTAMFHWAPMEMTVEPPLPLAFPLPEGRLRILRTMLHPAETAVPAAAVPMKTAMAEVTVGMVLAAVPARVAVRARPQEPLANRMENCLPVAVRAMHTAPAEPVVPEAEVMPESTVP